MKYVLAAMCGLMVLFMGGCAVVAASASAPFFLLPAGIVLLNLMMLGVIFKWTQKRWPAAFYILGALDLLIAIGTLLAALSSGPYDAPFLYLAGFAFLVKGVFSIVYIWRKPGGAT